MVLSPSASERGTSVEVRVVGAGPTRGGGRCWVGEGVKLPGAQRGVCKCSVHTTWESYMGSSRYPRSGSWLQAGALMVWCSVRSTLSLIGCQHRGCGPMVRPRHASYRIRSTSQVFNDEHLSEALSVGLVHPVPLHGLVVSRARTSGTPMESPHLPRLG